MLETDFVAESEAAFTKYAGDKDAVTNNAKDYPSPAFTGEAKTGLVGFMKDYKLDQGMNPETVLKIYSSDRVII
jgi:hypothetical protein